MSTVTCNSRERFLSLLPKRSVGVEVGVWMGDFSFQILENVTPMHLHLIDPWEHNDDGTNYSSTVARTQDQIDAVYKDVVDRFSYLPVTVHRKRSLDAAANWSEEVDWVYIDGIHTHDAVAADLKAWWPHVRLGGFLSGHDMWIDGVRAAVVEFCEAKKIGGRAMDVDGNFIIWKI